MTTYYLIKTTRKSMNFYVGNANSRTVMGHRLNRQYIEKYGYTNKAFALKNFFYVRGLQNGDNVEIVEYQFCE